MGIRDQMQADLAVAMRQGDTETRGTLRLLFAAIKQVEIDQQTELDDDGVQSVLKKQARQRHESIRDAETAGRPDLIEEEQKELEIIEGYLPAMMTTEEIRPVAQEVIEQVGASGMQDMGKVMKVLMPRLKDKADGRVVSDVVRTLLQA